MVRWRFRHPLASRKRRKNGFRTPKQVGGGGGGGPGFVIYGPVKIVMKFEFSRKKIFFYLKTQLVAILW